jgi:hypothetical protein
MGGNCRGIRSEQHRGSYDADADSGLNVADAADGNNSAKRKLYCHKGRLKRLRGTKRSVPLVPNTFFQKILSKKSFQKFFRLSIDKQDNIWYNSPSEYHYHGECL